MSRFSKSLFRNSRFVIVTAIAAAAWAGSRPTAARFLVTNDDTSTTLPPSSVTFYNIGAGGALTSAEQASTGANGMAGGYFGIDRVAVTDSCVFASNAQSENISPFDARSRKPAGLFRGSRADNKLARDGIGLTISGDRLYAAFSGSSNIGTFRIEPGCKLQFLGDVHAQGLKEGIVEGIAARGAILIATYGDGSMESFDISGALPVSNGDAQYSTGSEGDLVAGAVDVTRDAHYALFGGGSTGTTVEVSDISSGKLTTSKPFHLGTAWNAGSVRLSPDESVIYISNSSGGRITAAFFDPATGAVQRGCTSSPLKGFYRTFTYLGGPVTELTTGTGGLIYVPELGSGKSYIAALRFTRTATGCTLTETGSSPVPASRGASVLSIGVYPPRPF